MKQSPLDKEINSGFLPSKFSAEGFLGSDTRDVPTIIAADMAELESAGVSREDLAGSMERAFSAASGAMGKTVELSNGVTAEYFESRGKVPSPFRGDGVFEKGEVLITVNNKNKFYISRLSIHLIKKHCFFQGRGARYRIEPREAVSIFIKK